MEEGNLRFSLSIEMTTKDGWMTGCIYMLGMDTGSYVDGLMH